MKHSLRSFVTLLLALCMLLSACSKGPSLSLTEEETSPATEAGDETETETREYPFVPVKTTWEMIESIPIATPDMTEDELRQICVDFAVLQQSFEWTPTHDLDYLCPSAGGADEDGKLHCKAGTVYGGLPYGSGGLSLYSAMDFYDEENGVLDTSALTGKTTMHLSNHCSSSIRWAFGRVSTSVKYTLTSDMLKANGCIPLGPYSYQENVETFADLPTKTITSQNGEQVMYQSYALLKKADGVVTYANEYGGHTRMILTDAVVVRGADGSIDGSQSYVTSVEQYSTQTNVEVNGATVAQHGELNKKYTFNEMFKSGYIPFTIPELCGMKKVERAWATLDTDSSSYEALQGASVSSNYMIAKVNLTLLDESGSAISVVTRHIPTNPTFFFSLSSVLTNRFKEDLKKADKLLIQAFVASGETLTIFEGKVA